VRNPVDIYRNCIVSSCFYDEILICIKNGAAGLSTALSMMLCTGSNPGHPQLIHRCQIQTRLPLPSALTFQSISLCVAEIRTLVICRSTCVRANSIRRGEAKAKKASLVKGENVPVKAHLH
jgi:hypothetical protein